MCCQWHNQTAVYELFCCLHNSLNWTKGKKSLIIGRHLWHRWPDMRIGGFFGCRSTIAANTIQRRSSGHFGYRCLRNGHGLELQHERTWDRSIGRRWWVENCSATRELRITHSKHGSQSSHLADRVCKQAKQTILWQPWIPYSTSFHAAVFK